MFLAPWVRLMKARLRRAGMQSNDYVFGMSESGYMQEAYILRLLTSLPKGVSEIYFHPAIHRWARVDPLLTDYRPDEELSALLSPAVRQQLRALNIKMTTFQERVGIPGTNRAANITGR
jgi:chitin disaccharide deacetylase